jgi:hypothetical protein
MATLQVASEGTAPNPPEGTISFRHFLQAKPPGSRELVHGWVKKKLHTYDLDVPDPINLKCVRCGVLQNFSPFPGPSIYDDGKRVTDCFLVYRCRNCNVFLKRFALTVTPRDNEAAWIYKHGEDPAYGIDVPNEMRALLKEDAKLLEKALKCEAASLGIGAFVYYRRILENMKERLFDEVIEVAKRIDAGDEAIQWLNRARADRQFTKSIREIKSTGLHAIYIEGHNPLTLLYEEVSDGVHSGTDEENLASAQRIRVVLAHLAGRLEALMLERDEVKGAISAMLEAKRAREARRAANGGTGE